MTGKSYYITTLPDWQRHASRFANSHWVGLDPSADAGQDSSEAGTTASAQASPPHSAHRILVLIEADEGVHLSLEDDPAFEPLPHPFAPKPISDAAQAALTPHGVPPGATMFDATEILARVHPLLRHRVF